MSITNWIFPLVTITVFISSIVPASSDKRSACMSLCGEFMEGGSSFLSGPRRKSGMAGSVSSYRYVSSSEEDDVEGDVAHAPVPVTAIHECLPSYPGDCSITCEAAYGAKCSDSCPGSRCEWFKPIDVVHFDWEDWACVKPGCNGQHPDCSNTRCPDFLTGYGGGLLGL